MRRRRISFVALTLVLSATSNWPGKASPDSCTGQSAESCVTKARQQHSLAEDGFESEDRLLQTDATSLMHLTSSVKRRGSGSETGAEHDPAGTRVKMEVATGQSRLSLLQTELQESYRQLSGGVLALAAQSHILAWVVLLGVFLVAVMFVVLVVVISRDGKESQAHPPDHLHDPRDTLDRPSASQIRPASQKNPMTPAGRGQGPAGTEGIPQLNPSMQTTVARGSQIQLTMGMFNNALSYPNPDDMGQLNRTKLYSVGTSKGTVDFGLQFTRYGAPGVALDPAIREQSPEEIGCLHGMSPTGEQLVVGQAGIGYVWDRRRFARISSAQDNQVKFIIIPDDTRRDVVLIQDSNNQLVFEVHVSNSPSATTKRRVQVYYVSPMKEKAVQEGCPADGKVMEATHKILPDPTNGQATDLYQVNIEATGDSCLAPLIIAVIDRLGVDPWAGTSDPVPALPPPMSLGRDPTFPQPGGDSSIRQSWDVSNDPFGVALLGPPSARDAGYMSGTAPNTSQFGALDSTLSTGRADETFATIPTNFSSAGARGAVTTT